MRYLGSLFALVGMVGPWLLLAIPMTAPTAPTVPTYNGPVMAGCSSAIPVRCAVASWESISPATHPRNSVGLEQPRKSMGSIRY